MLELVIAACLAHASADASCRDFPLLYDPQEVSLLMCVAGGQVEIARWQASNPEWTVSRWRCGYVAGGVAEL